MDERSGPAISRRRFLASTAAGGAAVLAGGATSMVSAHANHRPHDEDAPWFEASIAGLQHQMAHGRLSSRELTHAYLLAGEGAEPARCTPSSRPIRTRMAIAARRDAERRAGTRPRTAPRDPGPAQGQRRDGRPDGDDRRLARARGQPRPARRHVTRKLREAGAVVLGKANLSEWANFRGFVPDAVSTAGLFLNGWSARGGFTRDSVRAGLGPVRVQLRIRRGRVGQPVHGRRRHRDGRLDRLPRRQHRASSDSSRRSASSPRRGSSRSPTTRTRPVRWAGPCRTWRSCSTRWSRRSARSRASGSRATTGGSCSAARSRASGSAWTASCSRPTGTRTSR